MKHVRIIAPLVVTDEPIWNQYLESVRLFEREDLKVTAICLDAGPKSIANRVDEALLLPNLIDKANASADDGVDAILVDCMADPGIGALRECLSIPVIGPAEISMQVATLLGHRFSILTEPNTVPHLFDEQVRHCGLDHRFASCRALEGISEFDANREQVLEALLIAAENAVYRDAADVLIVGCTRYSMFAEALKSLLLERQVDVPVINPSHLAINMLASLLVIGLSHSKIAYPYPVGTTTVNQGIHGIDRTEI